MGSTRSRRGRPVVAALLSVSALLSAMLAFAPASTASVGQPTVDPASKIEESLRGSLAATDTVDFWVRFEAAADLSGAPATKDWATRGQQVVDALQSTAEASQVEVRRLLESKRVEFESYWVTNAVLVKGGSSQLATELASLSSVAQILATRTYEQPDPSFTQGQTMAPQAVEWGVGNINADDVWSTLGVTGEGIVVASIDSGVQFDHPALVGKYRGNNGDGTFTHDYNWKDTSAACSGAPCDLDGHGTHTMGTMIGSDGANQVGVAPGAKWIEANGCNTCSDADLIEAGQWMLAPTKVDGSAPDVTKRPNIVNNSWGSIVPSTEPFMEDISIAWAASGIFGIFSNGNSGPNCSTSGSPGSRTVNYSVGAYDIANNIASFSGRGPGQDGTIKPNISAPGVNVRSSLPGSTYGNGSGTSMAAPHTAGAVALLWSAVPALVGDVEGTRELLDDTAIDKSDLQCGGTADDNNVYGEGRLDALSLVQAGNLGPTGTVAGTVTDEGTGSPLTTATVHVVGGEIDRTLTVGANGGYSIALPIGDYEVTATAFGYATETASVTVTEDTTSTVGFAMAAAATANITGRVTDGSGHGWPLYAKVTVAGVPNGTYFTKPNTGRYTITLPAGASYDLTITPVYPGYQSMTETVALGAADVVRNVAVPVNAETCNAFGYGFNYDGTSADFNDGQLPAGWTIVDNIGNGEVWRFDDPANRGNLTGGDGDFAIIDSDFHGSGPTHNQDSSLVTPVLDFSAMDAPIIGFNQDYNDFGAENADVDVSIDGGATWTNLLRQTADVRGPRFTVIPIPQAAGQPAVQVRFHYFNANFEFWWELDNVFVGKRTCDPTIDGGYLVGNVKDTNTGGGVNGATVALGDTSVKTAATPEDSGLDDGFYWMFSTATGTQSVTASAGNYTSQTKSVSVDLDGVTLANFSLKAGQLSVTPGSVEATHRLGDRVANRTFTVTNTGTAPATLEFGESGGDFVMQKADGTTMSRQEITTSAGAPLQRLNVPVSVKAHSTGKSETAPDTCGAQRRPVGRHRQLPDGNHGQPSRVSRRQDLLHRWRQWHCVDRPGLVLRLGAALLDRDCGHARSAQRHDGRRDQRADHRGQRLGRERS